MHGLQGKPATHRAIVDNSIRVALIADTWMMGLPTLMSISSSWSPDLGPAVQHVRKWNLYWKACRKGTDKRRWRIALVYSLLSLPRWHPR